MDNPRYFDDENILVFKQNISWQDQDYDYNTPKTRNKDETTFPMSDTMEKEKHQDKNSLRISLLHCTSTQR